MSKNLPMAMAIAKKSKKKYAKGGQVPPSAKTEARPMPGEKNDSGKAPKHDGWLDRSTEAQAQKPSRVPLSQPPMAKSDVFSIKRQEHLPQDHNRQGPSVPALKMKRMAHGGMMPMSSEEDQAPGMSPGGPRDDMEKGPASKEYMSGMMAGMRHAMAHGGEVAEEAYTDKPDKGYGAIIFKAEGGEIERGDLGHAQEEAQEDKDKATMEYESDAPDMYEEDKKKHQHDIHAYAEGGEINLDEIEDEKHSSIAAAIMAKRDREKPGSDSDEDKEMMMAEGGQVDLEANNEEGPADADDLVAGKKEDYQDVELSQPLDSNEEGDEREDESENKHDKISAIRRKMSMKRQFR